MSDTKKQKSSSSSNKIAEAIRENERRKELRQLQEELRRRISMAKNGRLAYEKKNLAAALTYYKKFLHITARAYQVELKDLHPRLFAEKNRVSEAILISVIAFDLTKIYDHIESPEAAKERAIYFTLFLNFSIGMPFQVFVSDNLKKYIKYTPSIKHIKEFEAAHKALGGKIGCFVATEIYTHHDAPEVLVLRNFRDRVLVHYFVGRIFIASYYKIGPILATFVRKFSPLKKFTQIFLDFLIKKIIAYS